MGSEEERNAWQRGKAHLRPFVSTRPTSATGDSGTYATRLTMHIDTSLCRYIHIYSSSLPSFLESQLAPHRLVSQVQQHQVSPPTESTDMEVTVSSHTSGTAPR
jgi:hypothetical protein